MDLSTLPFFPYVVGTKLMLMVSELSEAMEGHRKGLMDHKLLHRLVIVVEIADAVLQVANLAGKLGCDLGGTLVVEMAFNTVRPDNQLGARMAAGGKDTKPAAHFAKNVGADACAQQHPACPVYSSTAEGRSAYIRYRPNLAVTRGFGCSLKRTSTRTADNF